MQMQYKFDVMQALKDKGFSTWDLRKNKLMSEGTLQRLRHAEPVSWSNIEQICTLLECQPGDLLECVKDEET